MNSESHKSIFWVSVAVLGVVLIVLVAITFEAVGIALGHRNWGSKGGAACLPCLIISLGVVTGTFRRLGLLEKERTMETLRRPPDAGPVHLEDAVELKMARSLWMALAVLTTVIALLIFAAVLFLPAVPGTKPSGYAGAIFFLLFSLGPWYGYATNAGLIARVDQTGVRGDNALPKSSARWVDIASCEITLMPQPWGKVIRCTFRDAADKTLVRLMLGDGAESSRFLSAIRECFGAR